MTLPLLANVASPACTAETHVPLFLLFRYVWEVRAASPGEEAGYLADSISQWLEHRGCYFSVFIDSCPENHLLAETNVLLTRGKKCFQTESRMKDLMKRLFSHTKECNENLGEGACRGRMAFW